MSVEPAIREALNDQVNRELFAAYLYLSMVNYFESEDLPGFAHWMRHQAREEVAHAGRIMEHLHDRGATVELQSIEKPPVQWDSPLDAMQDALDHESRVTEHIHEIYDLASENGDHAATVMLQWFVEEQVEEEDTAGAIVAQLERVGDSGASLLVLDGKLGARE